MSSQHPRRRKKRKMPELTPSELLNQAVGRAIERALRESLKRMIEFGDDQFKTIFPTEYIPDEWQMLLPPDIRPGPEVDEKPGVIEGPKPERRQLVDIDSTENRRRKVLEWQVRNVSHLKGLSNTKEVAVRKTIATGIRDGWSKKMLTDTLIEKHGLSPAKAKLDAVNEIRRANSWAFRKTAYQLGYRMGKFRVHPGACPICLRMNGRIFPLTEDVIPDRTHPNCVVPDTIIRGECIGSLKSFYSGEMIELITASNNKLTITPNHPIFTENGIISASQINEGNNVIRYSGNIEGMFSKNTNHQYGPASIKEVFDMFNNFIMHRTRTSPEDLHGDAVFGNGYVDIVGIPSILSNRGETHLGNSIENFDFSLPHSQSTYLPRICPHHLGIYGIDSPLGRFPSSRTLAYDGLSIPSNLIPSDSFSFGLIPEFYSCLPKVFSDGPPAHFKFFRDFVKAHSSIISFDPIIKVRNFNYTGHVYDLQTVQGYYMANNLFISNCRCWLELSNVGYVSQKSFKKV